MVIQPAQRNVRMGFLGTLLRSLSLRVKTLNEIGFLEKWQHIFLVVKNDDLSLFKCNIFSSVLMVSLIVNYRF